MKRILFNQLNSKKTILVFLAILFLSNLAFSQTRLYLNLNTTAAVSPAYNTGWNVVSGATRYEMNAYKDGSTITSKTTGNSGAIAVRKCLLDQWVSEPLDAQTITGTFTGQVRFQQSSVTAVTGQGFVYLRVINPNGTIATEVGSATTSNLTTTLTNRTLISLNVGTLNITAGQRIAIDLGWNYSLGVLTNVNCTVSRGSSSGTDLAVNNTTTTANTPWVEFSQSLVFLPPANDDCITAQSLTPGASCVNTAGTLKYATPDGATPLGCFTAGTYYDVWYSFVATTYTHTVTLSSLGANFTAPRIQVYRGSCGALISMGCASATSLVQPDLIPGTTYFVRIANFNADPSGPGTVANFNICITNQTPPANDVCSASSPLLTSAIACSNTTGNLQYASSTGPAGACGGATATTTYDVWYRFVANSPTHFITLSGLGGSLSPATTYIETFSGTCGALTSLGCQNASTTEIISGLTSGVTYYVRIYVTAAPVNTTTSNWNFSICIQQPPANDECAGAVNLTPGASCVNTAGTLHFSTPNTTGIPIGCFAAGTYYDVWYRFTATTFTHTVTLSGLGGNITAPRIQLYSGTCGALVSEACAVGTTLTEANLTPGTVYYIRVANFNADPAGAGGFSICVTSQPPPANDQCSTNTLLTSGTTCSATTGNLQYAASNGPAGACGGATASTTYDVWYRFVATATTQSVLVNGLGANLTPTTTYVETFSGTCGGLVSIDCQNASSIEILSGLTIGATYYVRVYVTAAPNNTTTANWNFSICIQQPPANDECAGAITLAVSGSCSNTSGTLNVATANGTTPLGCFAAGTYYDVWYRFVATTTIQTVTLSGLGANFTAPRIQIYSGTCGALVSEGCATGTSLLQYGLTVGDTYYVRIANYNVNPSGGGAVANFSICITAITPPVNNDCSGATVLTSNTSCSTTSGTLLNSSPSSSPLPSCGNSGSTDVWYRFIAQSNRPVITLSGLGANLITASPFIQLFAGGGGCGSLVQLACAVSPLNTAVTPGGVGLTINSTYYIRITTNANTGVPTTGAWGFSICITDPAGAAVDFAKTYVNITDGTAGGTIDPGDVLEIRSILVVQRPGGSSANVAIDNIAFFDTLTANKGYRLLRDSMALKTNEGKLFRPSATTYFTDNAADADAAWITTAGAGSDTALQINMGVGASRSVRGKLGHTSRPSNFGSTCIIMATYRVRVTAPYGTKIKYGGGAFSYRDSATGVSYTINFPPDSLIVYASPGACPDAVSATNVIGDEVNGTFGAPSGSPTYPQNRSASANTNYAYATFGGGNGPGDYYYGITNNTSGNGSTVQTIPKPTATSRVFSVWDISGDHTGATNTGNTSKGNLPCNLALPISATNPCGYMLVVNSAYRADVAFKYSFSGACTETYYEISAWMKNVCSKCGCDSLGTGSTGAGYQPTGPGDSSGIRPNVAFQINGVDYYTTGDIVHTGVGGTQTGSDTLNRWIRKSFVYKTQPNETSFTMTFRNNAPGGGGNDWAIDDISIRTCYPNMTYSPSGTPSVCAGRTLTIRDTVRSFYNTYIYYKWQRSTNLGVTWNDIAGTSGVATLTLVGGTYQFVNSYTLPPSATTPANNGDRYRMVVATTASNLAGACNYSDPTPIILSVNNCIDIDDDNDGIPDYVEFNNPLALADHNVNNIPNWNDPLYPGFVDNNADGVNDNFDWGADANNNGIPNYMDPTFTPWVDANSDGINDLSDKDLDGIPNQYDLDSDNDAIPDVVESYGVDTDGDGVIDNYTDTDGDGFSQNVDGNSTGVQGSGNGLGNMDFDGDGIPNYLDSDSDNDGIPDVVEAGGVDANNNGIVDNFVDTNSDGLSDNNFAASALLRSGFDISPVDGRADSWPNKNLDRDFRPNAYDLDSDGDGIVDVIEAGLPDVNLNGIVDGIIGANGWSNSVSIMPALNLRHTDADGKPDYLDIDADDDGIPDNIEGQSTAGYLLPTLTDADGDGLMSPYDNTPAVYGGSGIFVYDHDADGTPDYRDSDSDGDGLIDRVEGNDFNLNKLADDNVTLTGLDTDNDGLDNRFDSLNSVTNIKGTSYRMGNLGSFTGDATPGSRTTVQRSLVNQPDRDWRSVGLVLPVQFLSFTGHQTNNLVTLSWTIIADKEIDRFEIERSTTNTIYTKIKTITDPVVVQIQQSFTTNDDIAAVNAEVIYYRLKVIGKAGEIKYSNVIFVRKKQSQIPVSIMPNPANGYVNVNLYVDKNTDAALVLIDKIGRRILVQNEKLTKGPNNITLHLDKYSPGVYALVVETSEEKITKQLIIVR